MIREALSASVDALRAAGIDEPSLDAELLLCEATGWDRAHLVANPDAEIAPAAARRFGETVRRRLRREPVAYILGRRGFRQIELAVDPRVLIPRPETELLVELALEIQPRTVLDVGTGSGAIALAIADELPDCAVTATDTSTAALEVARANAERLGLSERVEFVEGTLPLEPPGFDLVLANLPYVSEAEWRGLEPEVTEWEPREALLGGPDGLDAIRALLVEPPATACLALEVGAGQAGAVGGLMREAGFSEIEVRRDLAGIERIIVGRSPSADFAFSGAIGPETTKSAEDE
ncbi:MAG TPA: peptide chain release factor N(5)-glutamine methyltransferase [Solirubrobacterales bacterium]|nr:peptide chain release factor N(5)-glutamine methyltransferase [Solirubrobacterales bacterium]